MSVKLRNKRIEVLNAHIAKLLKEYELIKLQSQKLLDEGGNSFVQKECLDELARRVPLGLRNFSKAFDLEILLSYYDKKFGKED